MVTLGDKRVKFGGSLFHRMITSCIDTLMSLVDEYTTARAESDLVCAGVKRDMLDVMKGYGTLYPRIIDAMHDALTAYGADFIDAIGSQTLITGANVRSITVPHVFESLLDVASNDRGCAVGCGEIVACLLFAGTTGAPNGRYDLVSGGSNVHVKDHRSCDSTPLGRPSTGDDWRDHPVLRFVGTLGAPTNFGSTFFRNNEIAERAIKERYGYSSLYSAATAFENELHEMLRSSAALGDAVGLLILKTKSLGDASPLQLDPKYRFEFVTRGHLYFHSVSADSLKVCDRYGRFIDAVIYRSRNEEKRASDEIVMQLKDQERERSRALKEQEVAIQKEHARMVREAARDAARKKHEDDKVESARLTIERKHAADISNAHALVDIWNAYGNMRDLASQLGVTTETARKRARKAEELLGTKLERRRNKGSR